MSSLLLVVLLFISANAQYDDDDDYDFGDEEGSVREWQEEKMRYCNYSIVKAMRAACGPRLQNEFRPDERMTMKERQDECMWLITRDNIREDCCEKPCDLDTLRRHCPRPLNIPQEEEPEIDDEL